MKITRRNFLKSSAISAALMAFPGKAIAKLSNKFARTAPSPDNNLVIIELNGGNCSLETLIPKSGTANGNLYRNARPFLHGKLGDGVDLGNSEVNLTPNLPEIKTLYDNGEVAFINGVGYPDMNMSHFKSMDIWYQGSRDSSDVGWIGRYLDQLDAELGTLPEDVPPLRSVVADTEITKVLVANNSQTAAIDDPATYGYAVGREASTDLTNQLVAFEQMYTDAAASTDESIKFVGNIGLEAIKAKDSLDNAIGENFERNDGETTLSFHLRILAKLFNDPNTKTTIGSVVQGGYDRHSYQAVAKSSGQTYLGILHQRLSSAINTFLTSLDPAVREKTLVLVFSEFGRRVKENGNGGNSTGTDHGAGGMAMVLGPVSSIVKDVHGAHPDLSEAALYRGSLTPTVDFRDVYGTILQNWLGRSQSQVGLLLDRNTTGYAPYTYSGPMSFLNI